MYRSHARMYFSGASPLAEGRELKCVRYQLNRLQAPSPLAEGRELKFLHTKRNRYTFASPLAEGRELKYCGSPMVGESGCRPSRRGVN